MVAFPKVILTDIPSFTITACISNGLFLQ